MNVLFIGDIVGNVGRAAVKKVLPALQSKYNPHIIIANGENAAAGRGITSAIVKELLDAGVHGITMGNHTWDNKDIFEWLDDQPRIVRPANFAPEAPGQGAAIIKANGKELAIINLQGRTFLPPIDCPFRKADELIEQLRQRTRNIFVDFHAEATSEKIAMGWHLDGKASVVVGTHTHVQTNDDRILPNGTAYITDVGMVGSMDGVLGMERGAVLHKFLTQLPSRFVVDEGDWHLHGVSVEIDEATGKAKRIQKIRLTETEWLLM
ncbi:TIGR00282 family metallophosphoesterase [Paenibacillus lycopersici]|uniref:TIGR00282 family metallophosphoesterase n=1 Tax=Paenibacillus lycopersici TaxID=2704462 RepID=A0A6C0FUD8_9BACL|nr:TIGR00282 family metallophosphoesterase [Paenibacillus lycopersici]QHT60768.1 TIGR00282 family metallophosphoesterase [Paenibacillus lycopersici]